MRLLWFSHFVPYPPKGGAHQRSYHLLRHASKSYETTLVGFNLHGYTPGQLSECEGELRKYCSRVEFWQMPIEWKGARWRARLILSPFERAPYGCTCFWSPELDAKWKDTLQRHQGTLVHFDSIDLALFAGRAAGFRKVLNHHNCESAMAERRAKKEPNPLKRIYLRSQARKLALLEREVCPRFNVNLAVSEVDMQVLHRQSPEAHFHVVENGTDTGYFAPGMAEEEPDSLIFASSFYWYPNISALQLFVREIWPLVKRQRSGVRLYVAGMKPSDSLVRWLKQDPDITVVASPPDIRPWIARAAVFVCPMVDGGGTKVKLLDAMAMGKAIVSTSVGCEGLEVTHGDNILIADTPEEFASTISQALESRALRERLGAAGRGLVERNYSWEVVGRHLEEAYECALSPGASVVPAETSVPVGSGR
ncbi:MAG TPA: glycosyltransferase [Terriglobia bacterium]|nr:glycosyltransferase [Terriglobia bacterium]